MDISKAGIKLILETEKIAFKLKKKITPKPIGENIQVENCKVELILGDDFRKINNLLARFKLKCIIPLRMYSKIKGGKPLAWFVVKDKKIPAVVEKEDGVEFAFDVGKTFLELVNEKYFKAKKNRHVLSNVITEKLYKILPVSFEFRKHIYQRYYRKLHNGIKAMNGFKTNFPIDSAGYILHNLFIEVIKKCSDYATVNYWPEGYGAAFLLTHDVDPTRYAYKKGIHVLLSRLREPKSTINLVSKYVERYLKDVNTRNEIGCHGYVHDRKFSLISRRQRDKRIRAAKQILENRFRRKIIGFRAPALQRTDDLYKILFRYGFEYDMSMIDSQREEPNCGRGVSYNLPYHTFDFENKKLEEVLEIPTSAPDCISPVYFGYSLGDNARLFEEKVAWIRKTGGICNFIIHAPAWGDDDARQRMWLLDKLLDIDKKGFWIAMGAEVNRWWRKRESVRISVNGKKIKLKSKYNITGLVVKSKGKQFIINLEAGKGKCLNIK